MAKVGKKEMPVGVRKGGTRYPRYSLSDAISWSKKLVSKTHLGPQPQDIIFAGVVDSKSTAGEIRVSALKQYNLMEGNSKAYQATNLAKGISAAPDDEIKELLREAALHPPVFKGIYEAFHGDEVSIAKLRQRASDLSVHPDQADDCVQIYVSSLEYAGLLSASGEKIRHESRVAICEKPNGTEESAQDLKNGESGEEESVEPDGGEKEAEIPEFSGRPRAVFHVNVNLDASLDTEKLQKQWDYILILEK